MIDIRKLKELVRLMVDNDLTELDLRDSEEQVTMRRGHGQTSPTVGHTPVMMQQAPMIAAPPRSSPAGADAAAPIASSDESGLLRIESEMR